MSKYLDTEGLKRVWNKIKGVTDPLDERITNIEINGTVLADTLPIGATVYWDDVKELPDNWEYVDEELRIPQNLLINGDFKIWQRGEAITVQGSGGKSYTADMWEIRNQRNSAAQMVHQKADEGKGTGFGFPGLGSMRIYQWLPIEEMRQYDGKHMTRVWSVNKKVYSETFLLNLSASDGTIEGGKWRAFYYLSNSNDVLNYAALYPGKIAYPHVEEDDAIALLRCKEWVEVLPIQFYGFANAGIQVFLEYIINMKDVPTVTLTNGTLSNLTSVKVNKIDENRLRLSGVVTKEGMYSMLDGKAIITCEPL